MDSNVAIGAASAIIASIATAIVTYRKTEVDNTSSKSSNKRDDFTVVVDKMKEIIEYRESQIEAQQKQIDVLIKENQSMRKRMKKLMDNYEEMKDILSNMELDPNVVKKINAIYKEVIEEK